MLSNTVAEDLLKALPILASGMLGFLGALGSQALSHRYSEKREKLKLKRDRFEMIVRAVYKTADWMRERGDLAMEGKRQMIPTPFTEVQMLQKLYFPELGYNVNELISIQGRLIYYFHKKLMNRLSSKQLRDDDTNGEDLYDLMKEYDRVITEFTEKCHQLLYKAR